jgi:uncharacterized lipoprotein YajG
MRFVSLLAALSALLLTGCALTRTPTVVNFVPSINAPFAAQSDEPIALSEITVKDSRQVVDGNVLTHKMNGRGEVTTGAYVTEQPVADLFTAGLRHALQQNGVLINQTKGQYELSGEIMAFNIASFVGLLKGTLKSKLIVRLDLIDKGTDTPIWRQVYTGNRQLETALLTSKEIGELFSSSANDVVKKLLMDEQFRKILASQRKIGVATGLNKI